MILKSVKMKYIFCQRWKTLLIVFLSSNLYRKLVCTMEEDARR